ncbi:hypothetical protein HG535_0F01310 [Zygotorulaspora mrakii]|uniref:Peroxisomal adenine nucleotide transporter 1 n=1 Tax=Zygotorulaspora mrakii TaxID=42260 RepID=A0A7H9B4U9_ZYGMR|nr:uncharacterized protein HG535_0F01310 [Zygotorulaspora mrakii]QLG73620.1 hypothetical protein HG535_0F01310 [Zygotorulaspora mrakii]
MASFEAALTGAVASSLANIAVYPLDLSKTLLQTQVDQKGYEEQKSEESTRDRKYNSALDCIYRIFKARGFKGLYQGMTTSVLASFIQSFCYFFWYTLIRKYYSSIKNKGARGRYAGFSTFEELLLGVVAAATSQLLTNPVSVISTRQQTMSSKSSEDAKVGHIVKQIVKEQNGSITGLWKGLKVSLVLTINPSITYASYQKLKSAFFSADDSSRGNTQLSAGQNFMLGVLSKMISTIITQPLIVSKASLQRRGSKFTSFQQVLVFLYQTEGVLGLWKGIRPQLAKGVLVQGLLFMFKGELSKFIHKLLLVYVRKFAKPTIRNGKQFL